MRYWPNQELFPCYSIHQLQEGDEETQITFALEYIIPMFVNDAWLCNTHWNDGKYFCLNHEWHDYHTSATENSQF